MAIITMILIAIVVLFPLSIVKNTSAFTGIINNGNNTGAIINNGNSVITAIIINGEILTLLSILVILFCYCHF